MEIGDNLDDSIIVLNKLGLIIDGKYTHLNGDQGLIIKANFSKNARLVMEQSVF